MRILTMAVIAVWKCDRDATMFADLAKEAEEYDKMLELAANISYLIEQNIPNVDEAICESIGLLLAKHRDNLAKACKGKPEILLETQVDTKAATADNVSPLVVATAAKK
jgi:dsDNA-binding SOS-regulon protein